MNYNAQTSVYYLLNVHMKYEYIRFCGFSELTEEHNEYQAIAKHYQNILENNSVVTAKRVKCMRNRNCLKK